MVVPAGPPPRKPLLGMLIPLLFLLSAPLPSFAEHPCLPSSNLDGSRVGNSVTDLHNVSLSTSGKGCTVVASATMDTTLLQDFTTGLRAVESFLGRWGGADCKAFVLKRQGAAAEYTAVTPKESAFHSTQSTMVKEATNQGRTNSGHLTLVLSSTFPTADAPPTCTCDELKKHHVIHRVGLYSSSESYNYNQAVHEYAHVYQSLHGFSLAPTWYVLCLYIPHAS